MEPNQQNKTNGRKTTNDALITLLRVSVIATFGLLLCAGMAAAAFPADWTHSDLITIEEHSGSDLSDYQILVELNVSNFDFSKAQPDGADIRFAELDDTLLSYWIEAWDSTDGNATVWVKVPGIPANGAAMIRMYCGNAGATSESNGSETFDWFDDFSTDTITGYWHDSGKVSSCPGWSSWNRGIRWNNGHMEAWESSGCYVSGFTSDRTINNGFIRINAMARHQYHAECKILLQHLNESNFLSSGFSHTNSVCSARKRVAGTNSGLCRKDKSIPRDVYHLEEIKIYNDAYKFYFDNELIGESVVNDSIFSGNKTIGICVYGNTVSTPFYFDDLIVGKYVDPEPTVTIGTFLPDPGNTTTSHIHIDGKNCVNMPFVARLTDTLGNPIASGTLLYSLGGAQFVKTTDACGYSTFTPTTTGTLIATYNTESITCEIIDDPTLCTGGCNFGTDPQADDLAITSFTTDKTTYARGETMTITIAVENLGGEMYKKLLIDTSSTKSDTGLPLGFVGSWSFVDIGSSTYEMRLYIPTSTDTGTYNVAGGVYADYLADGGSILDIASPVSVTIT